MTERIGILTGGGDCPGLNAAIRAVVRRALGAGAEVLGIKNGWRGLVDDDIEPLTRASISGILHRGGTILGTSRFDPLTSAETLERISANWNRYQFDALVTIGGEGTLSASLEMWRRHGYPIVGLPKTIDNDLGGTEFTFGFDTAVSIVAEAVDRLHSTAESHHRVMVVEVMGRHSGWIAAYGGIAGGADVILVPEHPFRISRVCELLKQREQQGRAFSIIVVAEDAHPHPDENFLSQEACEEIYRHERLGGIGTLLANEVERRIGIDTRVTKLGYVQRGGSPTAFDRMLATRFGIHAYDMIQARQWGHMAALQCGRIVSLPLEEAVGRPKRLDPEIYRIVEIFSS
jgi:6-phosphofructokinase 1